MHHREYGRVYIFAVSAIAVFLISLMLFRPLPIGYELESLLRQEAHGNQEEVQRTLSVDPSVELTSYLSSVGESAMATEPEDRGHLHVETAPVAGPRLARHITIRWTCRDLPTGKVQLEEAVDKYIAAHQRSDQSSIYESQRGEFATNIRFWQSRMVSLQKELNDYVEQELARRRQQTAGENSHPTTGEESRNNSLATPNGFNIARPDTQSVPSPAGNMLNPRWQLLHQQLATAEIELRGLQEKYTDAHPLVIESRRILQAYTEALQATPQFLGVPRSAASNGNPIVLNQTIAEDHHGTSLAVDESRIRQEILSSSMAVNLQASLLDAKRKRDEAELALSKIPMHAEEIAETTLVEYPATWTATLRAPVNLSYLLRLLLPSCLLGVAMAIPRYRLAQPEYLCSTNDVNGSLSVPIRGELSTDDGPVVPAANSSPLPLIVRRLVSVCELSIAAIVILMITCMLTSPGFGSDIVHNPLVAIGSTLERLGVQR